MKPTLLFTLAAFFVLTSALSSAAPTNEVWQHERQEWTLPLPASGPVDVVNQWGDIRVRTHHDDQVYVLANIQHHKDDPRSMNLVVNNEADDLLGLTAHFESNRNESVPADWQPRRIDLTVFVPAHQALNLTTTKGLAEVRGLHAPLTVHTETGDVRLRIKGPLQAESKHGDIQSFFLRTDWPQESSIETLTGDIEAIIAKGGRAKVALETHGQITTDFTLEITRDKAESHKTGSAHIGKDGKPLSLKSDRGAIKLLSSVVPDESVSAR